MDNLCTACGGTGLFNHLMVHSPFCEKCKGSCFEPGHERIVIEHAEFEPVVEAPIEAPIEEVVVEETPAEEVIEE